MRHIIIGLAALLLSSCASVAYNGPKVRSQVLDYPEVGKVTTAQVGDPMMRKGLSVEEQALVVTAPVDKFHYDVPAGTYKQIGDNQKHWFYALSGTGGEVDKNWLADPAKALAVPKSGKSGQLCVITVFNAKSCFDASYTRKAVTSIGSGGFQQTLLYNGRVGDKINIGYREFSDEMARPAFNNEVEYDLTASHTIGYKGAQIEVIEANNSSITYRVIKPFP